MLKVCLATGLMAFGATLTHASVVTYQATLAPSLQGSFASGTASVLYDDVAHTLIVEALFADLSGASLVAHVHCCTAAPGTGNALVAVTPPTLPGFPSGVTGGSYSSPFPIDLSSASSYNSAFLTAMGGVTAAELALVAGLDAGTAYFNIHTTLAPAGELRGYFAPVDEPRSVPEPGSLALLTSAGLGAAVAAWRRRRNAA